MSACRYKTKILTNVYPSNARIKYVWEYSIILGLTLKALMVSLCLQFTLNFKIRRGTQFKRQVDLGSPSPAIMIIVTTTTATTITITSEITYSMSLINEILKKMVLLLLLSLFLQVDKKLSVKKQK